ncbi:hypothetical protein [Paenibacillus tuaregi]|uniref:hypothetical protein n=1 Tax=Paenibacillus tuaregi TaxID=1816681 RepID=UPI000837FCCF|nr:hypothetical protein [Paenibacillus tuaregi]
MTKKSVTFDSSVLVITLDRTKGKTREAGVIGMQDATDDLLLKSRDEAPMEEGVLRLTAFSEVTASEDKVTGSVNYSAVNQSADGRRYNYALRTHEMGTFKNPSTPGTKPKYLERPLKANIKRYTHMISSTIRKGLG